MGLLCLSLFCYALIYVHSSLAIILKRKRNRVALLLLSYRCIVTINILWLFLTVPWAGLQCVIVVFPDHTCILFNCNTDLDFNHCPLYCMEALPSLVSSPVFLYRSGCSCFSQELSISVNISQVKPFF